MLSVAAFILVSRLRFIKLDPVWTYKANKMSISGRCKVCRLSITTQSRPQVETNMNLLHCQMFHSQSKGNCLVKLTYLFVKTIKISLSEQRFKKLTLYTLILNLFIKHLALFLRFMHHLLKFTLPVMTSAYQRNKKPFPRRSLSSIFTHWNLEW